MQLRRYPFLNLSSMVLFLCGLTVAAKEFIDTTSGVNELVLTSVEGVRGARDFDFYHRVSFSFKLYSVIGFAGRACKEHIAVGHILEYDGAIVFRVNTFFHCSLLLIYNVNFQTRYWDHPITGCKGTKIFLFGKILLAFFLFRMFLFKI